MPQMAPLNWLILFLFFTLSFFLFTIMNYFNKFFMSNLKKNTNLFNKKNNVKLNWKW